MLDLRELTKVGLLLTHPPDDPVFVCPCDVSLFLSLCPTLRVVYQTRVPICSRMMQATGMVNQFSAKVSTKDMSRRLWQQALQKAEEEHISPGVITDVPQSHAYYGSPQAARFLLGIEHVQTLYFIADSKER